MSKGVKRTEDNIKYFSHHEHIKKMLIDCYNKFGDIIKYKIDVKSTKTTTIRIYTVI